MKKILALVVAALMMLSVMAPAIAEDVADTKITVDGLMVNDAYKLYQVLTWDQTTGSWKLADGFTGLTGNNTVFPADQDDNTTREQEVVKAIVDGITQDEANAIAAMTALETGAPSTKATGTIESGSKFEYAVSADNNYANMGLYMAVITAGTPEYVYNPVFVSADFKPSNDTNSINAGTATYGANGIAKREEIHLTKTTSDSNQALKEAIDSYVGEVVTFDVNTTVPVYLDSYKNPSFVIYDNIETAGINLNADSIEITLGTGTAAKTYAKNAGEGKLAYDSDIFTVTATGGNQGEYTVTFNKTWLGNNTVAVPVHVQYKGTITNTANFNLNKDNNTVTVTYSNGPDDEKGAMRDRTNHYTFSLGAKVEGQSSDKGKTYELVKVAVDADGKPIVEKKKVSEWYTEDQRHPLAGATFGLYTTAACDTLYTNSLYPDGATFTTLDDGVITFKGLAAGDYWLQEISAPNGYIKDLRKVHIEIIAKYKDVTVADTTENGIKVKGYTTQVLESYKVKVNNVSTYDSTNNEYGALPENQVVETEYTFNNDGPHTTTTTTTKSNDSDLTNTKGVELPSTGGMGTTILYIGGSILVLAAVILLVTKRRMKVED